MVGVGEAATAVNQMRSKIMRPEILAPCRLFGAPLLGPDGEQMPRELWPDRQWLFADLLAYPKLSPPCRLSFGIQYLHGEVFTHEVCNCYDEIMYWKEMFFVIPLWTDTDFFLVLNILNTFICKGASPCSCFVLS